MMPKTDTATTNNTCGTHDLVHLRRRVHSDHEPMCTEPYFLLSKVDGHICNPVRTAARRSVVCSETLCSKPYFLLNTLEGRIFNTVRAAARVPTSATHVAGLLLDTA